MTSSDERSQAAKVVYLTERGWPPIGPELPRGQQPVFRASNGVDAYNIDIQSSDGEWNNFSDYWYIWNGADDNQDQLLKTEINGAFQTGSGNDQILIYTGWLEGSVPAPYFMAGPGDDNIDNRSGQGAFAYGGAGDDLVGGGDYQDTLYGDEADTFVIDFSYDPLYPSPTHFALNPYDAANDGNDVLFGGKGNDTLVGGGGNDRLSGDEGADTLIAGDGSDYLYGGPRGEGFLDILTGGGGSDVFVLSYGNDDTGSGGGFWAKFFGEQASEVGGDIAGDLLESAFAKGIGDIAGDIAGPIGGAVLTDFIDFLLGLESTPNPRSKQDIMMVTDFDPSMDVLILPLISKNTQGDTLTSQVSFFEEFADGETDAWGIEFLENNTLFAEARLSDDYIRSLGFEPNDRDAPIGDVLSTLTANPATLTNDGSFSSLASPEVLGALPSGGFTPAKPGGGAIPSGATVNVFGAIGGQLVANDAVNGVTTLAGTQYSDALTINAAIVDPAKIGTSHLQDKASTLYGLAGGDVLYGGQLADTLYGGDGNDKLYSFIDNSSSGTPPAESLSGGAGNDILYGGASGGTFDGGAGTDTFGVVYGNLLKNALDQGPDGMQLVVDLTQGYAAERPASEDPNPNVAPAGPTSAPPFGKDVPNVYKLVDIENAIGGPLNDWIRAASGSVIEGGAGPDLLDFGAGNTGLSYSTSAEGVYINTDVRTPLAKDGDAQGDVFANLGPANTPNVSTVTGSEHDDKLYAPAGITMTGLGGADVFGSSWFNRPVGSAPPVTTVTDFSQADGDKIDLRPEGTTSLAAVEFTANDDFSVNAPNGTPLVAYKLEGFTGTLTADDFILAQPANGTAIGTSESDGFAGGAGDDLIEGRGGGDFLHGNAGDDTLKGQDEQDYLYGGEGDDLLVGGAGNDLIEGGIGDDFIVGGAGDDHISGNAGDDTIDGGDGADTIDGGPGDDVVLAGLGDDILVGGFGDDVLQGGSGLDTAVFAGAFADHRITGADSTARTVEDLVGGGGRDTLAAVELLQFDDGVLDLRTGEFDDGATEVPSVQLDDGAVVTAEPEPLLTAPVAAIDPEPLLTPVAA